jgi:hypothetical protein
MFKIIFRIAEMIKHYFDDRDNLLFIEEATK